MFELSKKKNKEKKSMSDDGRNEAFQDWKPPVLEHGKLTQWNWVIYYPDGVELGYKCDIGAFTAIFGQHGVEIGPHAQIGSLCAIYSISTISTTGKPITGKVVIEEGAMIGTHSTVMPGVTIGKGAIVGAHSLVTEDVPAGEIWVGVPAQFKSKREET